MLRDRRRICSGGRLVRSEALLVLPHGCTIEGEDVLAVAEFGTQWAGEARSVVDDQALHPRLQNSPANPAKQS